MNKLNIWKSTSLKLVSCILGVLQISVWRFGHDGVIDPLTAVFTFLISSFLFWIGGCILFQLFASDKDFLAEKKFFAKNRNLIFYSAALLLFWLPHLIVYFPGGVCPDSIWQIKQIVAGGITTHHPVFDSMLMGYAVKAGSYFMGSANAGLAVFIFCQAVYSAFVLGYTLKTMQDYQVKRSMILLAFLIYTAMPEFTGYINVAIKDTLFSISFVLFATVLIRINAEGISYLSTWKHWLLWIIGALGTALLRNNGIYVFLITMMIDCIYVFVNRRKYFCKTVIVFCVPFLLSAAVNKLIDWHYHPIDDDAYASALSLPLQQTARYVRYHEEEVTEEERTAIDAVVDYDLLAEVYNPRVSDPVKHIFRNKTATSKQVQAYLATWFRMVLKHPGIAADATAEQNYYMFDLSRPYNSYYDALSELEYAAADPDNMLGQTGLVITDDIAERQRSWSIQVYHFIDSVPILNLLDNIAFWNTMLFYLLAYMIYTKRKEEILTLVPLYISLLVCIASPVIFMQQRYAFPIVYSMPLATAVFFRKGKA